MDIQRARDLIAVLADGTNPLTGEILPADDSCNQVEIVRALHTALGELDKVIGKTKPQNAGKPWTRVELDRLAKEFDGGIPVAEIAKAHGRSKGAIESKLVSLGKIEDTYFAR